MAKTRTPTRKRRARKDALAPVLDRDDRRRRGKVLLRNFVNQGLSVGDAKVAVMQHPDLAGSPPCARSVDEWWRQLRLAPGDDLIDDEVRGALAHPIEDHRKVHLQAIAGRVTRHNLIISQLADELVELTAKKKYDRERAAALRQEIREEDKRIAEAWKQHAAITGIDDIPVEAHIGEPEARTRLVDALVANAREFTPAELKSVVEAFGAEIERLETLAREQQRSISRRELAAEVGLVE